MKDPLCVAPFFPCIHIRCRHMNAVPPEGLSECNSLPLAMMNLLKSHSVQRRQNGKTTKRKKNSGSVHIAGLKSRHQAWLATSFVFRNYFSHVVFSPTGLTGLTHLVALVLPWIWWTAFFSRPWNPQIGCATSWRTGKSWRLWWWLLWQETSFVRWGVVGFQGIPLSHSKSIWTKRLAHWC